MKKFLLTLIAFMLAVSLFMFSACGNNPNIGELPNPDGIINPNNNNPKESNDEANTTLNRYIAKPVEDNYRIDYSFTEGNYDYWYLYLGYIDFVPVSFQGTKYYNGQTPISLSYTSKTVTQQSITESTNICISNTIELIDRDVNVFDIKSETKFGSQMSPIQETITVGYSHTWDNSENTSDTTSKTDTYTTFSSWAQENSETLSYTIGDHGEKTGFYRLTLFSTSDVYVVVVYNKEYNEYYYEYSVFARPNTYFTSIDYNETPNFTNINDNKLILDTSLLNNLPEPSDNMNSLSKIRISSGATQSLAIDFNGNLWTWGHVGYLEDGSVMQNHSPVQIKPGTKFITVSTGTTQKLAIDSNGNLWTWGFNHCGQLGDGTLIAKHFPIQIKSGIKFTAVSAAYANSFAIDYNGNLWAWGDNSYGQLGDGTLIQRSSPVQIKSGTKFITVSAGYSHSLAIDSNGNLWAWGQNEYGQLGDNTTTNKTSPIQIKHGTKFTTASAGNYHSLAIDSNGNLWTWGRNSDGQLGDGTSTQRYSPIQIKSDTKFTTASAGDSHNLAIDSNGSLWAWGSNYCGKLGDGTTMNSKIPIQIKPGTKFIQIGAGQYHSLAMDFSGNLWAWGDNKRGQLGDGTIIGKTTPVPITLG